MEKGLLLSLLLLSVILKSFGQEKGFPVVLDVTQLRSTIYVDGESVTEVEGIIAHPLGGKIYISKGKLQKGTVSFWLDSLTSTGTRAASLENAKAYFLPLADNPENKLMTVAFAPDKELKGNTSLSKGTVTLKVGGKDKTFAVQCDFLNMSDRWVAVVRPFTVDLGVVEIDNKKSHVVMQLFLAAIILK